MLTFQSTLSVGRGTAWRMEGTLREYPFQSTLSVGRGTTARWYARKIRDDFNPPSPWGEGLIPLFLRTPP